MCGISGVWDLKNAYDEKTLHRLAESMASTLQHRGPDSAGVWVDERAGVAFGHRRLAILDLSQTGHQPQYSSCGRYVVAFNGEIYNHKDLREELERRGAPFRGHSDTEVLLAGLTHWGLQATVTRCVGMFAAAIWDSLERRLFLVRDRIGEKPLYYGFVGNLFGFASELKALRQLPGFEGAVDPEAVAAYLQYGYVPAPLSIYAGFRKLAPGTILTLEEGSRNVQLTTYWSVYDAMMQGLAHPVEDSIQDTLDELHSLLNKAVQLQSLADVPLGAFLSGGVDSSLIVALMQAQSSTKVKTFTIAFSEAEYNEGEYARAIAAHLGTDHTELCVSARDALKLVPQLNAVYDEPFSDSSQIPTILVSRLARRHVTVSLSGDGGDELFGGYERYVWSRNIWGRIRWVPRPFRRSLAAGLMALSPSAWDALLRVASPMLPKGLSMRYFGDRIHKLAAVLPSEDAMGIFTHLISYCKNPTTVMTRAGGGAQSSLGCELSNVDQPLLSRMMYRDTVTYLPDDILTKVDRASMSASLETRAPFLDHRVVEFAWRMPEAVKFRDNQTKWPLRQLLDRYLPRPLVERPKMGFAVPLDDWLRGPLRPWAAELLAEHRLRSEGWLDPEVVRVKWNEHQKGTRNWQHFLWNILMLQSWLESNRALPLAPALSKPQSFGGVK